MFSRTKEKVRKTLNLERLEERVLLSGTMITGKTQIRDADGDLIDVNVKGTAEIYDSLGGAFNNGDSLGNIVLSGEEGKISLQMKNLGGGNNQFDFYGDVSSAVSVKQVKLDGNVFSQHGGIDVAGDLEKVDIKGNVKGDFDIEARNLSSVKVGNVEGSLDISVDNYLGSISSRGDYRGLVSVDYTKQIKAKGMISDLIVNGDVGSLNSESMRYTDVNGSVEKVKSKNAVRYSLIGNENERIGSVKAGSLEDTTLYGKVIERIDAKGADSARIVGDNISRVSVKGNANDLKIIAGLNLGGDREYGTPDDRWEYLGEEAARIERVDIKAGKDGEIRDVSVSAGVRSLDETWGNGDETGTFGYGYITDRVSFSGALRGNNYVGAEHGFELRDNKIMKNVLSGYPYVRTGLKAEVRLGSEPPPL